MSYLYRNIRISFLIQLSHMLYLYGDESNTAGADKIWAVGFLFSTASTTHMLAIQKIRKECSYERRELKYASTDYSQILCAVRLIDYFLSVSDLYFKIIIKDNLFFNKDYFADNRYGLDKKDMAYVSAYAELCRSIKPTTYKQHKKLLNIDDKGFRGNVILPIFLKQKDPTVVQVYRRDSRKRAKDRQFTGVSNMIQLADFLTGLILSFADVHRKTLIGAEKHKNIYRKALLSKCPGILEKCKEKTNYYWPNFDYQKINVFYWRNKNASLSKSPSRS